jgi:fibronectin type 3 domain-containing protein
MLFAQIVAAAVLSAKPYVQLSWKPPANSSTITGFRILRGTASGKETLLTTVDRQIEYQDAAVVAGKTYYYEVQCVTPTGVSIASNEASAKVP